MEKIYCLEENPALREQLLSLLAGGGYQGEGFADRGSLLAALERESPALVLLPGEGAPVLLERLRSGPAASRLPVIILAGDSSEDDRVRGLDGGADDYLTRPFGERELLSRIRAVLRRVERPPALLTAGSLAVDVGARTVRDGSREIVLTFKEFELLCCLLRSRGLVLTREKLMETVWGYDFEGETRTVDVHIKSLRKKLGPPGQLIQTVRGVGYKLM